MAEHSTCQPGRPTPQGEGKEISGEVSGGQPFQRAKSRGSFLGDGGGGGRGDLGESKCFGLKSTEEVGGAILPYLLRPLLSNDWVSK